MYIVAMYFEDRATESSLYYYQFIPERIHKIKYKEMLEK